MATVIRRLERRRALLVAVAGFVVCNAAGLMLPALGFDCTWSCHQLLSCSGATEPCPYCDLGIWDECHYWSQTRYPNTVFGRQDGGDMNSDLQGNIVCYEITVCGNADTNWAHVCTGSCQLSPAVLQYCDICGPVGTVTTGRANHYVCTSNGCGG